MVAVAKNRWSYARRPGAEEVAGLIRVLGNPIRLRLLCLVWREPLCVEFCSRLTYLSEPRVSLGFRQLYEAGLVRMRREGRYRFYWRVNRRMSGAYRYVMQMAWMAGRESAEVREDERQLELALKGEGYLVAGDLPWPRRDGWVLVSSFEFQGVGDMSDSTGALVRRYAIGRRCSREVRLSGY